MNRNNFFKKMLVFAIIALFFCVSIIPSINAINYGNDKKYDEQTNDINVNSATGGDVASLTFFTFGKSGRKQNKIDLPSDFAMEIKNVFEELEYKIVYEPKSIETQELKNSFISLVDEYGLISERQSKDEVLSLLNPVWLKSDGDNNNLRVRNPFSNVLTRSFLGAYFGFSVFCSVSSAGSGLLMPLFMLPRPRAVGFWFSYDYSVTSVANLFTGKGFLAGGVQSGLLLGFMGVGLSYAVPGATLYGFIGYSLFVGVTAELMEFYPPNNVPVISDESPVDGSVDVPVDLSELSFRISDADGDLMDYTVTTIPDIGSDQGQLKKNGVYSVPVSGLEGDKKYSWTIGVSDGKALVEKTFSFITVGRPPFDPFTEGWMYRKKITINHTQVTGDLVNFPVVVSNIDSDIRDHAQSDGDDILFMDGVGVANKLYHEIEMFDGSSGELVVWVKVPSLSSSVDTVFYLYYGNPSCSSQQFPEKVWDNNFKARYSMSDLTTSTIDDSTINGYDGIKTAANEPIVSTDGKIGDAQSYDGSNDFITISNSLHLTGQHTISMWIKPTSWTNYRAIFGGRGLADQDDKGGIAISSANGKLYYDVYDSAHRWAVAPILPAIDVWTLVSAAYDGNTMRLFYNGVEQTPSTTIGSVTIDWTSSTWTRIGRSNTDLFTYFYGLIDEVRISNIGRNSSWISTDYSNQNDPLSFFSFGPEETPP